MVNEDQPRGRALDDETSGHGGMDCLSNVEPGSDNSHSPESRHSGALHPGEGVLRGPSGVSRRQFAVAAAAAATSAALGIAASSAEPKETQAEEAGDSTTPADSLDDGSGFINMFEFEDFTEIINYTPVLTMTLPLGCTVYADDDQFAAVLQANEDFPPLTKIGCLDIMSGAYSIVLETPITGLDYSPSEVRIGGQVIAWVETNNATDEWVFYAAPFFGIAISSSAGVTKLGEGDSEWLPPQFAVSQGQVVWQIMPDPSGSHVTEASQAYSWYVGAASATNIWTSPGRFGCPPAINDGILTIAPRVNADKGVYYGITAVELGSLAQIDQLVLPASVRPFRATRIGGNFAFSIEANYGYGGQLGSMGYYIGPGSGPFYMVSREPSAQVCYTTGKYIVRSLIAYLVFDITNHTFMRVTAANNCIDYGDYPASSGSSTLFVTYATTKDENSGMPNGVLVRTFSLL